MKRFLTGLILGVMLLGSVSVSASTSFSDVNTDDWYYETVMNMTEKGLFEGKGNNQFCPNDTMTTAEFLTVLVRALYPEKDISPEDGYKWWVPVYSAALEENMITWLDHFYDANYLKNNGYALFVEYEDMDMDIAREQMAAMAVHALLALGEELPEPYEYVGDYHKAEKCYVESIRVAYAAGILVGDEAGRFNPKNTLTRAEASTVLYRIFEKSARSKPGTSITIYEGRERYNRNAQAGDIFVKKDGTQIVLQLDQYGVLGGGQGVAPDVGLFGYIGEKGIEQFTYASRDYPALKDSTGRILSNSAYYINATTGEGYWMWEYHRLCENIPEPARDGYYDGEVSPDSYRLYRWNGANWGYNKMVAKYN